MRPPPCPTTDGLGDAGGGGDRCRSCGLGLWGTGLLTQSSFEVRDLSYELVVLQLRLMFTDVARGSAQPLNLEGTVG